MILKMSDDLMKPLAQMLGLTIDIRSIKKFTVVLELGKPAIIGYEGYLEDGEDKDRPDGPSAEPEAGGGSSTPAP